MSCLRLASFCTSSPRHVLGRLFLYLAGAKRRGSEHFAGPRVACRQMALASPKGSVAQVAVEVRDECCASILIIVLVT